MNTLTDKYEETEKEKKIYFLFPSSIIIHSIKWERHTHSLIDCEMHETISHFFTIEEFLIIL